jgi:hypothetical protein
VELPERGGGASAWQAAQQDSVCRDDDRRCTKTHSGSKLKQQIIATGTEGQLPPPPPPRLSGSDVYICVCVSYGHEGMAATWPSLNLPSIRVDFHVQNLKQLLTDSDRLVVGRHVPLRTNVLYVRKRRMVLPRQA